MGEALAVRGDVARAEAGVADRAMAASARMKLDRTFGMAMRR